MATNMSRTLSQKITRQPMTWVSAPPSSGPMLKPSIRNPVQAPIARCPALRRRAGVDRSQGAGHRERRREALQGPSGQQLGLCAGGGNDAGRDAEQRQSDHRCQPRAEPISRLAAKHNAGRGDDQIGIDRPLHAG